MAQSENTFSFIKEGEYNLILGSSLSNKRKNQECAFHTVRYDFKPASVDSTKPGSVAIGDKNNVTIGVPHIQDSGSTIYNGSKRQCQKEFLLIIDKKTQTFTLERIGSNMQVKKTRSSGSSKSVKSQPSCSTTKSTSETTKTTTKNLKSKSPAKEPAPSLPSTPSSQGSVKTEVQESDSSSSSDDSSSDSESENKSDDGDDDDDEEIDDKHVEQLNSFLNCLGPEPYKKPPEFNQLSRDLQLSESGSDSD